MGFVAYIVFCAIVLGIAYAGVWALGYFLPGHPGIVDKIIWGIAIIIVVLRFIQAIGLGGSDVQIPQVQ